MSVVLDRSRGIPEWRCLICGDRPVIPAGCTDDTEDRISLSFRVSHAKCMEIVKEKFPRPAPIDV